MQTGGQPGLGSRRDTVTLRQIEERLEALALAVPSLSLEDWAAACAVLCPELYGSPPASRRGLTCVPGGRVRRWRYAQRVAHGRQVHSPLDRPCPAPRRDGAPPGA